VDVADSRLHTVCEMTPGSLPPGSATLRIGVHTPVQDVDTAGLRRVWTRIEAAGGGVYDWISVWDHFGSLQGGTANLEAVSTQAVLAASTTRVSVGCLVYSVGYRSPLQLASAIATIDHWSDGRAVLGLGAGYLADEYRMLGLDLPRAADRARHLIEAAGAVRRLLDGETITLHGRHVHLEGARCAPPPRREHLPIVIGGGGEQVTIPLAARLADGWNIPMASPADVARKVAVLRHHEHAAGRPTSSVETSVNVGLCFDESELPQRFGPRWEALRPAVCTGSNDRIVELIGRYRDAGIDRVLLSLRPPIDDALADDLDRFAEEIVPQITGSDR
jgi:alkanesulfonate monooxygenase SsuD/methylene tetrahydromethanopterin reductase-like flavin-dependent oxidoreductase (luciferase family)